MCTVHCKSTNKMFSSLNVGSVQVGMEEVSLQSFLIKCKSLATVVESNKQGTVHVCVSTVVKKDII